MTPTRALGLHRRRRWRLRRQRRAPRPIWRSRHHGEELHLPGGRSYSGRWGSWEGGLLHFGYTPEQVTELVGVRKPATKPGEEPFVPDDASIAELRVPEADGQHLTVDELQRLADAYR